MKLIKFLMLIMLVFVASYSAAPAAWSSQSTAPSWGFNNTKAASTAAAFDTLVGLDSTTLWADLNPTRNCITTMVRDAFTGTGADSVAYAVRVDCKDGVRGNVLYSAVIDTMLSSAGEAIALDFGGALKGNYFDIKLVGITGAGSQVIVNRVLLDETKPIVFSKTRL